MTLSQAAYRLGVSERTVRRWVKKGLLPAIQVGPYGTYRVAIKDVDALVRKAA